MVISNLEHIKTIEKALNDSKVIFETISKEGYEPIIRRCSESLSFIKEAKKEWIDINELLPQNRNRKNSNGEKCLGDIVEVKCSDNSICKAYCFGDLVKPSWINEDGFGTVSNTVTHWRYLHTN